MKFVRKHERDVSVYKFNFTEISISITKHLIMKLNFPKSKDDFSL